MWSISARRTIRRTRAAVQRRYHQAVVLWRYPLSQIKRHLLRRRSPLNLLWPRQAEMFGPRQASFHLLRPRRQRSRRLMQEEIPSRRSRHPRRPPRRAVEEAAGHANVIPISADGLPPMLTRRETVLGGALTLIWGKCACAQSGVRARGPGCTLEP